MVEILELLDYETFGWRICCDLKVVGLLTGLKRGYPEHSCFLCLWEGRVRTLHYTDHVWPQRITHRLGQASIENLPLVAAEKVILLPLHIKLGLMTQFVKSLDREGLAFKHLAIVFPRISNQKIKAGVFNGPQVDQLASNASFLGKLTDDQKIAFLAMIDVIRNFLGNRRADNYEEIVDKMIRAFHKINVNMSLKVHSLANHLDFFP